MDEQLDPSRPLAPTDNIRALAMGWKADAVRAQRRPLVGASDAIDVALAFVIVAAAAAWLCFSNTILPLADYPDNLARFFIQSHIGTDPQLAKYYQLFWAFQPNLALDAVAYLLAPFCDVHTIGRVTVWATFVSLLGGCVLLYRALHGRYSVLSLLPGVFILNRYFTSGFLGFLLTLGWALIALAAWIACRERPILRLMLGTVFATGLYFGHLHAFGIYAVCVFGYELFLLWSDAPSRRRLPSRAAVAFFHLVPAAILFFLVSPTIEGSGSIEWGTLRDKLVGIIVLFPGYNLWLEASLVGLCVLVLAFAWARGWATPRRDLLIAGIILALLYLALPNLLLSSYGADRRVIIPIALLAFLSVDWRATTTRMQALQWGLFAVVMAVQMSYVALEWLSVQPMYNDLLRMTSLVERGGRVAGATVIRSTEYLSFPPLHEVVSLFTVERSAFVPNIYAYPNDAAAPIRYSPAYIHMAFRPPVIYAPPSMTVSEVQARFDRYLTMVKAKGIDYLLFIDEPKSAIALPPDLQLMGETANGRGRLFKITGGATGVRTTEPLPTTLAGMKG